MARRPISLDRGLCAGEIPLRHHLKLSADIPGITTLKASTRVEAALNCLTANLIYAGWHNEILFYSRDNSYYARTRAGSPPWFTRSKVVAAVAILVDGGYAEETRTRPSPSATCRSRLRATTKLMDCACYLSLVSFHWDYSPPVIIRSREEDHLCMSHQPPGQKELIEALAIDVEEHNRFLASLEVQLGGESVEVLPTGMIAVANFRVDPTRRRCVRIFNGDLDHGGRWYGGWWQNVPAQYRPGLIIDGQPTVECDFAACQLRLMFGHLGLPDPLSGAIRHSSSDFDMYRIHGIRWEDVKRAFVIRANAGRAGPLGHGTSRVRSRRSHDSARAGGAYPSCRCKPLPRTTITLVYRDRAAHAAHRF